jgi:hypothetical protein
VRIDTTRYHILASRIDDLCTAWRVQVGTDLLNLPVRTQDVGMPGPFGCNNRPALD